MTKRNALGRGLSALLESASTDITSTEYGGSEARVGAVANIPLVQIEANPFNPRTEFEEESLQELKASIVAHGIIQPLTVRKLGRDKYQLISGERRFRACQLAGVTNVPCYIRIANDHDMLEMALVENIQRVDLNPIEVGLSYQRLIEECSFTQEKLSEKLGKSRSNITNFLRLLKLPPQIQIGIRQGLISMGHARALVSAGDEQMQTALFQKVVNEDLSVRDIEKIVQQHRGNEGGNNNKSASSAAGLPYEVEQRRNKLAELLEMPVSISQYNNGKGKLVIQFDSEKELESILSKLK